MDDRILALPAGATTASLQLLQDGHTVILALGCRDPEAAETVYQQLRADITGATLAGTPFEANGVDRVRGVGFLVTEG